MELIARTRRKRRAVRPRRRRKVFTLDETELAPKYAIHPEDLALAMRFVVGWINAQRGERKAVLSRKLLSLAKAILGVKTSRAGNYYLKPGYSARLHSAGISWRTWEIVDKRKFAIAWQQLLDTGRFSLKAQLALIASDLVPAEPKLISIGKGKMKYTDTIERRAERAIRRASQDFIDWKNDHSF